MTTPDAWDELCGALPSHQDEIMASHQGRPTMAVQDRVNGAGLPPIDDGPDPGTVVG